MGVFMKCDFIDNSKLIPKILPDNEVTLDSNGTPDWAKTLIMVQVRIATATKEGTLKSAVKLLDHYAEMGVNGLWVCPVFEPGKGGNGYTNLGPHTVDPAITGTTDYEKGWMAVKGFVDEAHKRNIVDSIKNGVNYGTQASQDLDDGGTYHYYTFCVTNHDYSHTVVNGNRAAVGYQAIFSPFIPVILLGEEFNNPHHHDNPVNGALYFNSIDWNCLNDPENRALYEDIKAMIRIRRTYPEIFEYYPEQFKDSNICKVNVKGCEVSQPYARYSGDTAMLVVPNYNLHDKDSKMTVYLPFADTGLDYYRSYTVTDVETGEVIVKGSASRVAKFTVSIPYEDQRVFMVKASGKIDPSELTEEEQKTWDDIESSEISDGTEDEPKADTYETVVVKKRKKKPSPASTFPVIPVVVGSVVGVLAVGGVTTLLLVRKKRKK